MPELPEADRIVSQISARSIGRVIVSADVLRGPFLRKSDICGKRIMAVRRRGKCPIFVLDSGPPLVSRLGMSGYWDFADDPWTFDYVEGNRISRESDVRVRIGFATGEILRYHDSRMFGRLETMDVPPMGPDAIGTMWSYPDHPSPSIMDSENFFQHVLRNVSMVGIPVKAALMEQGLIAGVGNIYANEACHLAEVDPGQSVNTIIPRDAEILWHALQGVLTANLGEISYDWLRVYRRHSCGTCGSPVERLEIQKRATFRCIVCQRNP